MNGWISSTTLPPTGNPAPALALVAVPGPVRDGSLTLLKRSETHLATKLAREQRQYRVAESPRVTPCDYWKPDPPLKQTRAGGVWVPCETPVRVKVCEPGMYWRMCQKCQQQVYYSLTELSDGQVGSDGLIVLTFRWVTGEDYDRWRIEQLADCDTDPADPILSASYLIPSDPSS